MGRIVPNKDNFDNIALKTDFTLQSSIGSDSVFSHTLPKATLAIFLKL